LAAGDDALTPVKCFLQARDVELDHFQQGLGNGCPISVNSTTFTEPAGPLGVSAGSAVTLSTFELGNTDV
jgi:hypothetical protein